MPQKTKLRFAENFVPKGPGKGRGMGGGSCPPTVWNICSGGPLRESKFINPCVAKNEFGKAGEVEDITKKVKGIASCEFPKQRKSFWLSTTQNLELKIFLVSDPLYEKNKLLL